MRVGERPETFEPECPFCHDTLSDPRLACEGCGTLYHSECWSELGGCATLGCALRAEPPVPAGAVTDGRPSKEYAREFPERWAEEGVVLKPRPPVLRRPRGFAAVRARGDTPKVLLIGFWFLFFVATTLGLVLPVVHEGLHVGELIRAAPAGLFTAFLGYCLYLVWTGKAAR